MTDRIRITERLQYPSGRFMKYLCPCLCVLIYAGCGLCQPL